MKCTPAKKRNCDPLGIRVHQENYVSPEPKCFQSLEELDNRKKRAKSRRSSDSGIKSWKPLEGCNTSPEAQVHELILEENTAVPSVKLSHSLRESRRVAIKYLLQKDHSTASAENLPQIIYALTWFPR